MSFDNFILSWQCDQFGNTAFSFCFKLTSSNLKCIVWLYLIWLLFFCLILCIFNKHCGCHVIKIARLEFPVVTAKNQLESWKWLVEGRCLQIHKLLDGISLKFDIAQYNKECRLFLWWCKTHMLISPSFCCHDKKKHLSPFFSFMWVYFLFLMILFCNRLK